LFAFQSIRFEAIEKKCHVDLAEIMKKNFDSESFKKCLIRDWPPRYTNRTVFLLIVVNALQSINASIFAQSSDSPYTRYSSSIQNHYPNIVTPPEVFKLVHGHSTARLLLSCGRRT